MNSWQKAYPPYEGTEPYLYLAFADGDARKIWPVMKVLLQRGCRVWYCTGSAGSSAELVRRQERSSGAAWTLLYLTDALSQDKESKSRIMVNQKAGKCITCLDTDGVSRYLAMDIREGTPAIALHKCRTAGELESALIRAEGYTQDILGKPAALKNLWIGKLSRLLVLLALLLMGCYAFLSWQGPSAYDDAVTFADPVIREAVRAAAGGGELGPEDLQTIRVIRLTKAPDSWSDLELLPQLQQIEISQLAAALAEDIPMDSYRVVLYGGAS